MDLVWYLSYGSNMDADRFGCYIAGGTPAGGNRSYPGCRDTTPPRESRGCSVPGEVYFGTWSPVWEGGRAFFDPDLPGSTYARAYLITEEQFADVYDQEMYRDPGTTAVDLGTIPRNGRVGLGQGRYETLIRLDDYDGHPVFTFTAPWSFKELPRQDVPLYPPSAPYLRMLGHGLLSTHGWSLPHTAEYLAGLRCVAGVWSADEIIPMLYPYTVLSCATTAHTSGEPTLIDQVESSADLPRLLHDLANRGIRRLRVNQGTAGYPLFLTSKFVDELQLVVDPTGDLTMVNYRIRRWELRVGPQ